MSDQPHNPPSGSGRHSSLGKAGSADELPTRQHEVKFSDPAAAPARPASHPKLTPMPLGGLEAQRTTASQVISFSIPLDRGSTVGRYMILNRVGEGGMGVVYAAQDPELQRTVAIKLLRPGGDTRFGTAEEQQARLLREAQAMAKISHPNVISVYDVGPYGDGVFVALEFIDGLTLREWIRAKPRPWREILDVFMKAGRGLAAAHAAGLVHRDFKPENVLVGKDGRVRVTDFGLARQVTEGGALEDAPLGVVPPPPAPEALSASKSSDKLEVAHLTHAGVVMGTPKYMAPEQHAGGLADARSDQFAFCAALYWGLYRKRPFDHRALSAATSQQRKLAMKAPGPTRVMIAPGKAEGPVLSGAALQALLKEPPRVPRLPKGTRRALMRGLNMVPEERFPGMDPLLDALDAGAVGQRRRRYGLAAAAAIPLLLVAGFAYRQWLHIHYCSGGAEKLASVWNPTVQAEMERGLKASGAPDAAMAATKVRDAIDKYGQDWVAMHGEACRATRVRGEQTEHVLSLRMVCLDRRLKDLQAVVGVLSAADEKMVEKATDTARGLASVKGCADLEALTTQVTMPEDPAARATIEKVGTMLAEVKALHDAGKYKQASTISREALRLAQTVTFRPMEAEALTWYGWLQALSLGDAKEGERSLVRAIYAARAGRDDLTAIKAAIRLIWVLGGMASRYDDAHFWEGMIRADLERVGGNEELECQMLSNVGSVLIFESRPDDAQKALQRALQLAEKDGPQRAKILSNLSIVSLMLKRYDEVIAMARESLDLISRTRGPDHVSAAYAHEALGRAYWGKKDFKNAHAEIERALEMYKRSLGPTHRQVSDGMDALAELLRNEGRYAEAVEVSRKALELKVNALGKDAPDLTYSLVGLGQGYLGLGQGAKAVPHFERALKLSVEDPVKQAEASFGLARALASVGDRARARDLAKEALVTFRKRGDVDEAKEISDWLESSASASKKTARR